MRAPAPIDPALPQLNRLLDAEAMTPVLARSLGRDDGVAEVSVARVLYKPRRQVAVHFHALVDGTRHDAVARATSGGEVVTWLPFDPALPALAEPRETLVRRLRAAGVDVPDGAEERLLGYKPGARAVVRLGNHVLKAYARDEQHRRAASGFAASSALSSVRTAEYEASLPELRATVQSAVDGDVPATAVGAAEEAGAIVARLQRAEVQLREAMPGSLLAAAERKADFIAFIVPQLAGRLAALVARLRALAPAGATLVPTHGDFHVDQLLRVDGDFVVIDFDDMCLAPPALDLATYLADVVRGRGGDLDAIEAAREPLLRGYGADAPALDWHVAAVALMRASHPFQRYVPRWPERVEEMVATAAAVLR
jgi:hypothetical protein